LHTEIRFPRDHRQSSVHHSMPDIEALARTMETAATRLVEVSNLCRYEPNAHTLDDMAAVCRDMSDIFRAVQSAAARPEPAVVASWQPYAANEPAWPKLVTRIAPDGSVWIVRRT
jgi:hypothetical protein